MLQAMLPKIARMTRTLRPSSNDDRWAEDRRHIAVATFWEVSYSYPVARLEHRVAANLALDTLHRLTKDQRRPMVEVPLDPEEAAERLSQRSYEDPHERLGSLTADSGLLEVITWGVAAGAITRAAVRQRVSRARRRLIAAVRADVEGSPDEQIAV